MKPGHTFGLALVLISAALTLLLGACGPAVTATLFVPPTAGAPAATRGPIQTSEIATGSPPAPTDAPLPTLAPPSPTPPCTDGLTYVHDITIPDGTIVAPGQSVDKQWLVKNSGTCDWDSRYRLKLIGGDAMGAPPLRALFPARAGTQATLRIVFTAPADTGLYDSQWQAVGPEGQPFGDAFYVQISVSP